MNKNTFYLFLIVILSLIIGFQFGTQKQFLFGSSMKKETTVDKLNRLLILLENDYVDQIDTDSLVGQMIENIVSELDPHSMYIPVEQQQQIAESMQGNFVGIGVSFQLLKDTIAVVRVLEDGPSEKAGLKTNE